MQAWIHLTTKYIVVKWFKKYLGGEATLEIGGGYTIFLVIVYS
jgi:hypothetical protein